MSSYPRTVARSHTRKFRAIRDSVTHAWVYDDRNQFDPVAVDPQAAFGRYLAFDHARLIDYGDGSYVIEFASNSWIVLR